MDTKYSKFICACGHRLVWGVVTGLAVCVVSPRAVCAGELEDELKYIDMLQQMRMSDIAEDVIADAWKRFADNPEAAPQLKVREIQGLLGLGKFTDVQKIVDAIQDKNSAEYWALVLAMADAYYTRSNYKEADARYTEFFKKVEKPTPALLTFYRDSAYKYAQMLLLLNRDGDALAAYLNLEKIASSLEEAVLRQVMAEVAELRIKLAPSVQKKEEREEMLAKAEGLADKLLWKQDVWFGKAIVMKAHVALLRDPVKGPQKARDMVETYMPQLKIIHESLAKDDPDGSQGMLRMSPMPQCRYLLAVMLLNAAQAEIKKAADVDEEKIKNLLLGERDAQGKRKGDGAYNHFLNVFLRFPESQWAADAGERAEFVRKLLNERYNANIQYSVTPEQLRKVRQMQFANARRLFGEGQFEQAAEKYLQVLNQFPEFEESVSALGDLAITYIELSEQKPENALMAEMVAGHLSERFSEKRELMRDAGDQVRRIGDSYGERRMEERKRETYAMFFRDYPEHYAAGQLIMSFGEREFEAKNYVGAVMYYTQIKEAYTNSPHYFDALSRLAQCLREEGNHVGEIEALEFYIAKLSGTGKPSHALVVGKFRLASAQREYATALLKGAAAPAAPGDAEQDTAEAQASAKENAAGWLAKAITGLTEVIKLLTDSPDKHQTNAGEKQRNEQVKEGSVFMRAVCLTQMQHPADKVPAFRKAAIEGFEEYMKAYPKGANAPKALLQIGTLHTILQDMNAAQSALEKLSKGFPDSAEAKNSVPMLAAALFDMGLRAEAVAKYREMFSGRDGAYTDSDFMAAARVLEGAKEHDMALLAYDKTMALTKDPALTALAKLGRARTLYAQKKYTESRKLLNAFIKDYAKSQLLIEANRLLVDVASEEGMSERDGRERTDLFNMAVTALRFIRRQLPEIEQQKEIDLMTGQVLARKMEAEANSGSAAKAAEARGQAIVTFNNIIDTTDAGNVKLATIVEKAYFSSLPLTREHKGNDQVIEMGEAYLRMFPAGRYRTDVQNWINQAK